MHLLEPALHLQLVLLILLLVPVLLILLLVPVLLILLLVLVLVLLVLALTLRLALHLRLERVLLLSFLSASSSFSSLPR